MPVYSLPVSVAAAIEMSLNRYVNLDADTAARLKNLSGKVIAIELRDLQLRFFLILTDDRILVQGNFEGEADTRLCGTSMGMARMSLGDNATDSLFAGDVEIHGDVEPGEQLQRILNDLDIDWEEQLSKLTGDVIAHQAGNAVRGLMSWGKRTMGILGQDIAEYLHEEDRTLPTRDEVNGLLASIDTLRSDVDRAGARVQRLMQQTQPDPHHNPQPKDTAGKTD